MRARALTLIEVVASLVLLATTATVLLSAHARSLAQLRAAENQQAADDLARELINAWRLERPSAGDPVRGYFENRPGWYWQRRIEPYHDPASTALEAWTLTIRRTREDGEEEDLGRYTWLESSREIKPATK